MRKEVKYAGIGTVVALAGVGAYIAYKKLTEVPPLPPPPTEYRLELSVDKTSIKEKETVTLTAKLTKGTEPQVGMLVGFYYDSKFIGASNTDSNGVATFEWTVYEAGEYNVVAKWADVVSNTVTITVAEVVRYDVHIFVDKESIMEGDEVRVYGWVYKDGERAPGEEVEIYANGELVATTATDESGGYSVKIRFDVAGTYEVKAVVAGTESETVTVTVVEKPEYAVKISTDGVLMVRSIVRYTAVVTGRMYGEEVVEYKWYADGSELDTTSENYYGIAFTEPGTHKVGCRAKLSTGREVYGEIEVNIRRAEEVEPGISPDVWTARYIGIRFVEKTEEVKVGETAGFKVKIEPGELLRYGVYTEGIPITAKMNGSVVKTGTVDRNGYFTFQITPTEAGLYTVEVEAEI